MVSWRLRRQLFGIIFTTFIIVAIVGGFIYFIYSYGHCTDGEQNLNEEGIDCGGSCPIQCLPEEIKDPLILWKRFFEIRPGVYDLAALIQNRNQAIGSSFIYEIKLLDQGLNEIFSKKGSGILMPDRKLLIFEPNLSLGKTPKEIILTLEFGEWEIMEKIDLPINILQQEFFTSPSPRMEIILENQSLLRLRDIDIAIFLKNPDDNIYAISRTFIDSIPESGKKEAIFTWPKELVLNEPASVGFIISPSL